MLPTLSLLAMAGLGAASFTNRNSLKGAQANLLLPGANSNAISMSLACSSFETECDGYCIPSDGVCCGDGDGAYCDTGYTCYTEGCCEDGETCDGPATGCNDGKELCGEYCVPEGSVCCEGSGSYCDSGETCTSDGFCETGSSSTDDSDTDTDSETTGECYSFQEECDGYCMPTGSVCCGDGYYCDAGETCGSGMLCETGDSSDASETTEESDPSETSDSGITLPSLDLGDDNDDTSDDTSDDTVSLCARRKGGGGGDVDVDAGGDDSCDGAGVVGIPVLLAGLVAVMVLA